MGEAAKQIEKEKEPVFVPVGPGAEGLDEAKAKDDDRDEGDERLGRDDEPEDGEEAEGQEERTPRGKETSRERRERLKRKRTRELAELNFYKSRNTELEKFQTRLGAVESRTAQNEGAAIDQRLNTIAAQLSSTDRIVAEAIKKQNGDDVAEALKIRDALRDEQVRLGTYKQQAVQRERTRVETQQQPAQQSQGLSPEALANAQQWMADHPWFNSSPRDRTEMLTIDQELIDDGFAPDNSDYWDELDKRARAKLPHRFKANGRRHDADDEDTDVDDEAERRPARKVASGPKFSSGGRERPLKKGEVYISKERKDAMIQAGLWEDPVARNRMLKRYADMDAEVASEKSAQSWR